MTSPIELHPMTDADFAWLASDVPSVRGDGLTLCQGGVGSNDVVDMLRGVAAQMTRETAGPVAWMIAVDGCVVGMTSFTKRGADGRFEIGYGVAEAYQGQGVATAAARRVCEDARSRGMIGLTAETAVGNPGSQRVLERAGFSRIGERDDEEDGALYTWSIDLTGGSVHG